MAQKAILYDATKCTACRGCQAACKQWNELEGETTVNTGSYENPPHLTPQTWLRVQFRETAVNGKVQWLFTRRSCMHCTDAACVEVCPPGALYRHANGFVSYDQSRCTGCGYCVEFCPFHVPRLQRDALTGQGVMSKCTFCTTPGLDRSVINQEPACVKTCPTGALVMGDRDKVLEQGRTRVAALKAGAHPGATVYGESELGGLHVLYVLANSPETYGLPRDPQFPVMATAWQGILQPLGWVAAGAAAVGLVLNLLVARARQIPEEDGENE